MERYSLPIGISSFDKIRKNSYYYIDKTCWPKCCQIFCLIRSVTMTIRKVFIMPFWPACFPVQAILWNPIMNMGWAFRCGDQVSKTPPGNLVWSQTCRRGNYAGEKQGSNQHTSLFLFPDFFFHPGIILLIRWHFIFGGEIVLCFNNFGRPGSRNSWIRSIRNEEIITVKTEKTNLEKWMYVSESPNTTKSVNR